MTLAPREAKILTMNATIAKSEAKKGVLVKLRGLVSSLKKAERKVADYVLKNPRKIQNLTVAYLAGKSGVSEATIIRFCRTLGFSGYQELKFQLAMELVKPIHSVIPDEIKETDSASDILQKVFNFNISTLKETLEVLSPKSLLRAAQFIENANKILIVGVGTSAANVQDAHNKFFRLGLNSVAQPDAHLQLMEASLLSHGDVIVAITHSGRTRDPIEALETARNTGAKTICITSNSKAPITEFADVVLLTSSRETRFRNEALASRIAQMSIVDALFTLIGMKNSKRAISATRKIEAVVGRKQILENVKT